MKVDFLLFCALVTVLGISACSYKELEVSEPVTQHIAPVEEVDKAVYVDSSTDEAVHVDSPPHAPVEEVNKAVHADSPTDEAFPVDSSLPTNGGSFNVRLYVEENLIKIMEEQEEALSIKHFGKPDIKFVEQYPESEGRLAVLCYKSGSETLSIPDSFNFPDSVSFLNQALHHELGHFYSDKLSESLGNGNWPVYWCATATCTDIELKSRVGIDLVSEGIGEYFGRTMTGESSDCSKQPNDLQGVEQMSEELYDEGYCLVKPIIDKHGKRGIEHLIFNPPVVGELSNLPSYGARIMEELGEAN